MKNRLKKFLNLTACFMAILSMSACGNNNDDSSNKTESNSTEKDYDLLVYNSDSDIADEFEKMCNEYSSRTGVIIKGVTADPEKDNMEQLRSYMKLTNPPNVFTVNNMQELKEWQDSGCILDFSNATQENFKEMANNIPETFRLSSNTVDSFGVPCTIQGYGYLVDPKILSSLFGGDKYRSVLNDLKECTYEEFEGMIHALDVYIDNGQVYRFTLNGNDYSLLAEKSGLAENLNGVFSFAGGDTTLTGSCLANVALSSVFKTAADANVAANEKIDLLGSPLIKFMQALDLITSSVSGKNGGVSRGISLVNNTTNSTNQAMKNFVSGKSVFMVGGNWEYDTIAVYDSSVARRLVFLPIKMPLLGDDIKAEGITEKKLATSIPVYVPRYYSINARSTELEQKLAQDFLVWVKTSELGEKYLLQEFGYIPYDIKDSTVIDNPLSRSMIEYVTSEKVIPGVYYGAPTNWCNDTLGKYIAEQYYTKISWSYSDYEKVSDYAISKWKEMRK